MTRTDTCACGAVIDAYPYAVNLHRQGAEHQAWMEARYSGTASPDVVGPHRAQAIDVGGALVCAICSQAVRRVNARRSAHITPR